MLGSIVVDGTPAELPCAHVVYAATPYTDSTLVWPDGRTTRTGYQLNALAADGPRMHALAIRHGGAAFGDGAHLVTIDPDGTTRDRGTVGPRFDESYAGAMVAGRYHVAAEGRMYVLDPDTATVLASAPMDVTATVGDWEYDPTDGGLYGVTAEGHGPALLLRTDPGTGNTRTVGRLPESAYGSAFLGPDRTLYTLANNDAGRSNWYAVPLARPADTAKLGAGPQAATSDATGCAPKAVAPRTSPPRPSPSGRVAPPPVAVAAPVPPSAAPPARRSPLPPPPPLPFEPVAAPSAHVPVESWTTKHWIAFMVFAFGATGVGARRMRAK